MKRYALTFVVASLVAIAMPGCGEEIVVDCFPEGIEVGASTTGFDLDPDGFTVTVESGGNLVASLSVPAYIPIEPGSYDVELTDVADNCSVSGDNPRTVEIPDCLGAIRVEFEVVCSSAAGPAVPRPAGRQGSTVVYP